MSDFVANNEEIHDTDTLTGDEQRAIVRLAAGERASAVAAEIGISPRTLQRWRKRPDFAAHLHDAIEERLDACRSGLADLLAVAVDTLRLAMLEGKPMSAVRSAEFVVSRFELFKGSVLAPTVDDIAFCELSVADDGRMVAGAELPAHDESPAPGDCSHDPPTPFEPPPTPSAPAPAPQYYAPAPFTLPKPTPAPITIERN